MWRRYGKEYRSSYKGDYYRELPADYTPAELGVLWNFGKVTPADFTATILDLAWRGYLRLEEYLPASKGLFHRRKVDYRIVNLGKQEAVLPHEHEILKLLFYDVAYRQPSVTFRQLEEYAKNNRGSFAAFWSKWGETLRQQGEAAGFFDKETKKGRKIVIFTGIAMLIISFAMIYLFAALLPSSTALTLFLLVLSACGVMIIIAGSLLRCRSSQGAEDFARWRAFCRFLLHFSEMQRHEIPSLIIWEHYLVYAVTLGVATNVIKQLQLVYPGLQDGSHRFGHGWYAYGTGVPASANFAGSFESLIANIQSNVQQSLRTATSKTSSDSGRGGGFSGGGGGAR